jgi:ATP-binding cassette subfamily C (CFTR/MRP) protein 1
MSINQTFALLITSWVKLKTGLGAIARLKAFERLTTSEISSDEIFTPPENWSFEGAVGFRNLRLLMGKFLTHDGF